MAALEVVDLPVGVRNPVAAPPTSPIDTAPRIATDICIDEQEFHWLVGILEGEGTFGRGTPSSPGLPFVRVSMTDRDVAERVAVAVGRAVVALRKRQPHHKRPYATVIKGAPAVQLMNAVRPFLGKSRQSEIDRAIASWHGRPARWRRPAADCSVEDCPRRGSIRGLCRRHYEQWRRAPQNGAPSISPREAPTGILPIIGACDDKCDVSWLAGLLEGEGTFGIAWRRPLAYPVLSVEMSDVDIVQRAARILGVDGVRAREPAFETWSVTHIARVTGHQAAQWMGRLRCRMGMRRSAAIDTALGAYSPIRLHEVPSFCVVPGCERPHRSRGLCHAHYMSWSRDRARGRTPRITPLR